MNDDARRSYRRFAVFFLAIGAVFLLLGVVRAAFAPDMLRGDPVPVALFLLAIGGTLRWTVRRREDDPPDAEAHDRSAERSSDAARDDASDVHR